MRAGGPSPSVGGELRPSPGVRYSIEEVGLLRTQGVGPADDRTHVARKLRNSEVLSIRGASLYDPFYTAGD